ncbi:MAG TPA: M24 family metallopeptidase [Longimicrobium sp.]|nr:M24 family metallopeptidase [Longimicrobium sp.]
MAVVDQTVSLTPETVERVRAELRAQGVDAWLLYNFKGLNAIASNLTGLPAMTRRWFVYLPAEGTPVAVTHRIEQQPWSTWLGENRPYSSWQELDARLRELLAGSGRVAMEYAENDAVPYVDQVPAGVLELVRAAGGNIVTSANLVSAFNARWSPEGVASHRRAAKVVADTAHAAFSRIAAAARAGRTTTEWEMRRWIQERFTEAGLTVGADAIVAVNANAANPHYAPSAEKHAEIRPGDLVLIDLYGKEDGPEAVYGDQTWMGYVGETVPERLATIFAAVRDARLAAIDRIRSRHAAGQPPAGWEADDAARAVITERGWGEAFIHRTGHSIDRELHGSGPNIDNLETRDTRTLIQGVGFSIEPGIYLAGDVGFRSEVNVYMGPDGPEVTTPEPQREVYALLSDPRFG